MMSNASRSALCATFLAISFTSAATGQSCPADLNGDESTNGVDLGALLAAWGPCATGTSCPGDLDGDSDVDAGDLTALLAAWGPCVTVPAWATLIEAFPDPAIVHNATLRDAITATGLAWRVRDTATQIELVLIPPVTYQRGCSPSQQYGCLSQEIPVHQVTLTRPIYMGRYEVTQAQWQARMGSNPSSFQSASAQVPASQVPNRPVERVSWDTIQGFLSATGMRLPTEAEWEFAYRAGSTTAFHAMPGHPNGTNDDSLAGNIAWFSTNSSAQTHPVGQKAGNGFGLHDMAGNVWEWVNDWYSTYPSAAQVDPMGPASGSGRGTRGGSWDRVTINARSSYRTNLTPGSASNVVGFRVARNP